MLDYGKRIRDNRRARGWTQKQIAEKADSSESAIAMIEKGNRRLSADLAVRLAELFEMPVMELITGQKNKE